MDKHLILIGGGHAHLKVMRCLEDFTSRGHRVTLISPEQYHYYSGMGPGMLSGLYAPHESRFHLKKMVSDRGGHFIAARVVRIETDNQRIVLDTGASLSYTVASFNVGSEIELKEGFTESPEALPVKPIINLLKARQRLLTLPQRSLIKVAVVGGGPAGVEVAGNTKRLLDDTGRKSEIVLLTGSKLLPHDSIKVRNQVKDNLQMRNIQVKENQKVLGNTGATLLLPNDKREKFDQVLFAMGVRPPGIFANSGLSCDLQGAVLVNRYLQVFEHPNLFGGGDCIAFDERFLPKVGVYAIRQNPILHHNLLSAMEGSPLKAFKPQKHFLLIYNLGNHNGVLLRRKLSFYGHWPFWLKNWIDRRFMFQNQVSSERCDPSAQL